jgi:DNA-binding winged helix-turn-helix (wHTH) protein/TolB-like protein/Flp pilus assembly protein TadD
MHGRFSFSVFVFDADTAELTRNGRKLPMPEQTSLVLSILLQRAGTLVTREELQELIWPQGKVLNYESAMNKAIYQLRTVLRDNPKAPQFVETIPRRGYRFRADVTLLPSATPKLTKSSAEEARHLLVPVAPAEVTTEAADADPTMVSLAHVNPAKVDAVEINSPHSLPHDQTSSSVFQKYSRIIGLAAALCLLAFVSLPAIFHKQQTAEASHAENISMGIPPFEMQGADAKQLGESFRLDLTDALSQLPEVQVRAARSLANLRLDNANIPELSQSLHLDVLVLGKFSLQGKNCILQLELVRGRDASHLASFEYSGSEDELTTIRNKAQRDIFTRLELTKKSVDTAGSTVNPQAYKSYLMARDSASLRTPEALNRALLQYQDAISRDSSFARAYAGMATAYLAIFNQEPSNRIDAQNADLRKAAESATKALQLDTMLAEPHAVLGNVAQIQHWDFLLGEKELRRAIELDPHEPIYHTHLSLLLADEGRFEEAFAQNNLAHSDDPLWAHTYMDEDFIALCAHQDARAIAAAGKYAKLAPDDPRAHDLLAWAFFVAGRYEEAIAQWHLIATMQRDTALAALEDQGLSAYRKGGISAYVQVILHATEKGLTKGHLYENDFVLSEWYAYAGNRDQSVALVRDMVNRHDPLVIDLAVNPMYDNLHHDPRFIAILSQVGLTLPTSYPKPELQASLQ